MHRAAHESSPGEDVIKRLAELSAIDGMPGRIRNGGDRLLSFLGGLPAK